MWAIARKFVNISCLGFYVLLIASSSHFPVKPTSLVRQLRNSVLTMSFTYILVLIRICVISSTAFGTPSAFYSCRPHNFDKTVLLPSLRPSQAPDTIKSTFHPAPPITSTSPTYPQPLTPPLQIQRFFSSSAPSAVSIFRFKTYAPDHGVVTLLPHWAMTQKVRCLVF